MNNAVVKSNNDRIINFHKIIIAGDGTVGKTTLVYSLKAYLNNKSNFISTVNRTRFLDFETLHLKDEFNTILQIWDCQGQRLVANGPLDLIHDTVITGSSLIILVFSLDNTDSFINLFLKEDSWYKLVKNSTSSTIPILLIGNKNDKPNIILHDYIIQKIKTFPEIKEYIKISALTLEGIPKLLSSIQKILSDVNSTVTIQS